AYERILEGVLALEEHFENLVVVTNDVGSGWPEHFYSEQTLLYIEMLGRLNAVLATRFDAVFELVCGIPLCLKGEGLLP
ncbi:MAG: bifunctional adenosylcobinamide kinase/adenosylcobinamide-phosphate guanylyltransferase, partial [Eggerthellaceae bacterium]|nr:bifunctional adenosylcobinamide kinase/adenosylcobinamide-phosphate guanylyltransferase [Eggerthellaceae bacterium]